MDGRDAQLSAVLYGTYLLKEKVMGPLSVASFVVSLDEPVLLGVELVVSEALLPDTEADDGVCADTSAHALSVASRSGETRMVDGWWW